jgi:hypothetical protein
MVSTPTHPRPDEESHPLPKVIATNKTMTSSAPNPTNQRGEVELAPVFDPFEDEVKWPLASGQPPRVLADVAFDLTPIIQALFVMLLRLATLT